jgi:hypothetical protein
MRRPRQLHGNEVEGNFYDTGKPVRLKLARTAGQ